MAKRWVSVDSRPMGGTEAELAGLSPTGAPADFVSGTTGDGEVRVRVSCTTRSGGFTSRGELLRLSVSL